MHYARVLTLAASTAATSNLFVSDYNGKVTTLSLAKSDDTYTLSNIHTSAGCGESPSWLTIDQSRDLLFCVNEGFSSVNGTLSSFSINTDGSLTRVSNLKTPSGPVNSAYYGNSQGLAVADYDGAAISTFKVSSTGKLTASESIFFSPSSNGNPPNPHQVVVDPTGKYILVPDLGSDLVRVFSFDASTLKLKSLTSLIAAPGSGPRHLAFWTPNNTPGGTTYMYLVSELAGTVTSYSVTYKANNAGLTFKNLGYEPATGDKSTPQINAPAEVRVSPDNKFLVISNRNDTSFTLDDGEKSDSISTFQLGGNGNLGNTYQLWPAGGSFPRSFEINKAGDLVAIGLQNSQKVAIIKRDVATGLLQETVASIPIDGDVTSVVWG